jgi:hypothetical protein
MCSKSIAFPDRAHTAALRELAVPLAAPTSTLLIENTVLGVFALLPAIFRTPPRVRGAREAAKLITQLVRSRNLATPFKAEMALSCELGLQGDDSFIITAVSFQVSLLDGEVLEITAYPSSKLPKFRILGNKDGFRHSLESRLPITLVATCVTANTTSADSPARSFVTNGDSEFAVGIRGYSEGRGRSFCS